MSLDTCPQCGYSARVAATRMVTTAMNRYLNTKTKEVTVVNSNETSITNGNGETLVRLNELDEPTVLLNDDGTIKDQKIVSKAGADLSFIPSTKEIPSAVVIKKDVTLTEEEKNLKQVKVNPSATAFSKVSSNDQPQQS